MPSQVRGTDCEEAPTAAGGTAGPAGGTAGSPDGKVGACKELLQECLYQRPQTGWQTPKAGWSARFGAACPPPSHPLSPAHSLQLRLLPPGQGSGPPPDTWVPLNAALKVTFHAFVIHSKPTLSTQAVPDAMLQNGVLTSRGKPSTPPTQAQALGRWEKPEAMLASPQLPIPTSSPPPPRNACKPRFVQLGPSGAPGEGLRTRSSAHLAGGTILLN